MSLIAVKNPHSILAALRARPQDIQSIALPSKDAGDAWEEIAQLAQQKKVRLSKDARPSPERRGGDFHKENRVGLGEAQIKPKSAITCEELFADAGNSGLWLALDCIQDPHNLGSIFRTASFFGVRGILLTEERSAPMTGTVYDVSAGGVETIAFAQETNLVRSLQVAKDAGLWVIGTSEHAKESFFQQKSDRAWLMVLGNEEKGMRRLTQENCDLLCTIPMPGARSKTESVSSLNVSVAAGVMIAHLTKK